MTVKDLKKGEKDLQMEERVRRRQKDAEDEMRESAKAE